MQWLQKGTPIGMFILAGLVGVGGAVGATLFHLLIYLTTLGFYGHNGSSSFLTVLETIPTWQRILIPTLGGLLVGIIFKLAKVDEAEGEGVPEVMEALAHKRGTIRPIVAPIKILTAALTLGSGGSTGREGPVIQIGSAIGSSIGQFFKLPTYERSLLLAAGAAAAIGGTFGAPVAGILFTYEILKHKPAYRHLFYVAIAATIGFLGTRHLTGHEGLRFEVSTLFSFDLLFFGILLLVATATTIGALLFGSALSLTRVAFIKIHAPHLIKPALGGFAIGLIGLYLPYIHEPAAYPFMVDLLSLSSIPLTFLIVLLLIKIFATGITLGSGGSGGIFAPLLLTGGIVGAIIATVCVYFGVIPAAAAPLLVTLGMAGMFAAAAHAPLTAAVITYEMTENVSLIIPLLIVCFVSTLLAKRIKAESIYHH